MTWILDQTYRIRSYKRDMHENSMFMAMGLSKRSTEAAECNLHQVLIDRRFARLSLKTKSVYERN